MGQYITGYNASRIFTLTRCAISVTPIPKGDRTMPTKNPRVNIVVEPPLYSVMHDLATSEGISMSTIARNLIREAIDLREDVALATFADTRLKSFDRKAALSNEDVWK
jgi:predicted DNA-binding protein